MTRTMLLKLFIVCATVGASNELEGYSKVVLDV